MPAPIPIIELPKSTENPELAERAALLLLHSLRPGTSFEMSKIEEKLHDMDSATTFAIVDGASVLAAGVFEVPEPAKPDVGSIVDLAVVPEHRKRGVGSRVLRVIEQNAREMGVTRLEVYSLFSAVGFYRRFGYWEESDFNFVKFL